MDKIVIEVDLSKLRLGEDGGDLGEYILGQAALQIIATLDRDVRSMLRQRVEQIRDEVIREAIRPAVTEAIAVAVQPTDSWGQPTGSPMVTLREVIVKEGLRQLKKDGGDAHGRGTKHTILEQVIAQEVEKALRSELLKEVEAGRAQALAAVKEQAAAVIAETIARMAR